MKIALERSAAGDGRAVDEEIDLSGLQPGEPLLLRERHQLHLARVAEDRDRERATEIHVEATPAARIVWGGEAGALGDAALHGAARTHGTECRALPTMSACRRPRGIAGRAARARRYAGQRETREQAMRTRHCH